VSKQIRALIVDDETIARDRIRRLLVDRSEEYILAEAKNGVDAVGTIRRFKPDLIFLDIQMPGLSGFEVLQQIEERDFHIIFQTAFDKFAVQAFEANACDYLLKPFSEERFHASVDRALQRASILSIDNLETSIKKARGCIETMVVRHGPELKMIAVADIDCFISMDHATYVHVHQSKYICDVTIQHLSTRLPDFFIRLHRSGIARIRSISSVIGGDNMKIKLHSGLTLPVARSCRAAVRKALNIS
jgi:DNA-binding LytR/AlgR family response regulator